VRFFFLLFFSQSIGFIFMEFAESTSHGHAMVYTCTDCKTMRRIPAPPTLASDHDTSVPSEETSFSHAHASTSSVSAPPNPNLNPDTASADVMAVDVTTIMTPDACATPSRTVGDSQACSTASVVKMGKKAARAVPRRPPLFARDVGHVVFCGNERLDNVGKERGDGIYVT
jgi:ribonuclease P protein subunit RPR2